MLIYEYSAWGQVLYTNSANIPLSLNPLRYRGYVYDEETDLYYLQSRYYDPQMGRFLNGDGYTSTGQGFTGNNMFAYCGNNPIINHDIDGCNYDRISLLGKGYPGFSPNGGLVVYVDGQLCLYYASTDSGYLIESWTDLSGRVIHVRHHTDHGFPTKHTNPHDHDIELDSKGYDTLSKPKDLDDSYQAPGKKNKNKENKESSSRTSKKFDKSLLKAVGTIAVGYATYSAVKWGIALISATATGGLSALIAALTP